MSKTDFLLCLLWLALAQGAAVYPTAALQLIANPSSTSTFVVHYSSQTDALGISEVASKVKLPAEDSVIAWVVYSDSYTESGWDTLQIHINKTSPYSNLVKARAAGYADGYLQASRMYDYWLNYRVNEYKDHGLQPPSKLLEWITQQQEYIRNQVVARGSRSKFWSSMSLVMAQFDGLCEGYWAAVQDPGRNMTWHELYLLNSLGDLYDINVLFPPQEPSTVAAAAGGRSPRRYTPGHGEVSDLGYGELLECSALIKLDLAPAVHPSDWFASSSGGVHGDGRSSSIVDSSSRSSSSSGTGGSGDRSGTDSSGQRVSVLASSRTRRSNHNPRVSHSSNARTASYRRQLYAQPHFPAGQRLASAGGLLRDVWVGHNTWRPYYAMVRTWKYFDFPWCATGPVSFSASPGFLHSKDDWYTTDKFVVMETTNGIYNKSMYDLLTPKSVLTWQRIQVANCGANSGAEWVRLFQNHNSGSYNNQWMVLDMQRLQTAAAGNASSLTDILWVLEQVPGLTEAADVSDVLLKQGYWASYNVPFFPSVYNITGYPQPSIYSTCPRAKSFSKEASKVRDLQHFKKLMRLNRYQYDKVSEGLPNNAVAARYDLPAASSIANDTIWKPKAYGAVDAKVVDLAGFCLRQTYAICGPTYEGQPVFSWSEARSQGLFADVSHIGSVDRFHFPWVSYVPAALPEKG